jgi:hypothetical protein
VSVEAYPPRLVVGDLVRRGTDWSAGSAADGNGAIGVVTAVGDSESASRSFVRVVWQRGGADLCEGTYVYDPLPLLVSS